MNQGVYTRPSGLIVPASRNYEDTMRLVSSSPSIEGVGRILTPVIIVDDLSRVPGAQTVANVVAQQTALTPTGSVPATQFGPVLPSPSILSWLFKPADSLHNTASKFYGLTFNAPMYVDEIDIQWLTDNAASPGSTDAVVLFLAPPTAAELATLQGQTLFGPAANADPNQWVLCTAAIGPGANSANNWVLRRGRPSLNPVPNAAGYGLTSYEDRQWGADEGANNVVYFAHSIPHVAFGGIMFCFANTATYGHKSLQARMIATTVR